MSVTVLYTPEVLSLAVALAAYPLPDDDLPIRGTARSASCGSTIELGLALDDAGRFGRVGVRSQACAIGQAAAALFANSVVGMNVAQVLVAGEDVAAWLSGEGDLPDWPGMGTIAAARAYPARHGAVMLPWNAARQALAPARDSA